MEVKRETGKRWRLTVYITDGDEGPEKIAGTEDEAEFSKKAACPQCNRLGKHIAHGAVSLEARPTDFNPTILPANAFPEMFVMVGRCTNQSCDLFCDDYTALIALAPKANPTPSAEAFSKN